MVSPPLCGVGERRAEIVPQGGGRRHQTTGWHGRLMAVSRGREGRAHGLASTLEFVEYGRVSRARPATLEMV